MMMMALLDVVGWPRGDIVTGVEPGLITVYSKRM
jgi:hypothetical protein